MSKTSLLVCLAVLFAPSLPAADSPLAPPSDTPLILLVVGAAGTPQYGDQFADWAKIWDQVALSSELEMVSIGRDSQGKVTDRQRIQETISQVSPEGSSPLWIVLIGHGTFARNVAKFNLRGPDVSATELASWLQPLKRPVVVVNCASASGPFINRLSAKNRIVVTATKSGNEQNYARFGEYFARAIAAVDSDLDHDDEISVQEAFLRASKEVAEFYAAENRIATEHALIDDNGDGKGTPAAMFRGVRPVGKAKDGTALDGSAALRMTLAPAAGRLELTPEERQRRDEIERQLDQLRSKKTELSEAQYDSLIEPLLLDLARLYRAAEQR